MPGRTKKQNYDQNRDKIAESNKRYREKNGDKIAANKKTKVPCEHCGRMVSKSHMSRHVRESCKAAPPPETSA
jgi:hypothetical protein